jgi:hypothetical protein
MATVPRTGKTAAAPGKTVVEENNTAEAITKTKPRNPSHVRHLEIDFSNEREAKLAIPPAPNSQARGGAEKNA